MDKKEIINLANKAAESRRKAGEKEIGPAIHRVMREAGSQIHNGEWNSTYRRISRILASRGGTRSAKVRNAIKKEEGQRNFDESLGEGANKPAPKSKLSRNEKLRRDVANAAEIARRKGLMSQGDSEPPVQEEFLEFDLNKLGPTEHYYP